MENFIVLAGQTASGKTSLSVDLALKIDAEIISSDAFQVYKYMDIGSAKVKKNEMNGVKHHLIDYKYPNEEFNVSVFLKDAKEKVNQIFDENKSVILTGGSGLYNDSLVYSSYDFKEIKTNNEYRDYLNKIYKEKGKNYLYEMLLKVDSDSAKEIHMNNVKRVMRALEIFNQTGVKKSEINNKKKEYRYKNTKYFYINIDREKLYEKINLRVDLMIEDGLVDEVKKLLDMGYSEELTSMKALGYKEIVSYLKGFISLEEAIYIIKRDTRHFAKRQETWFKRNEDIILIDDNKFKTNEEKIKFILEKINA